jgi:hypothetical protein
MQWHLWVVLIAGSTGSALRAVRPSNLHITPEIALFADTAELVLAPARVLLRYEPHRFDNRDIFSFQQIGLE